MFWLYTPSLLHSFRMQGSTRDFSISNIFKMPYRTLYFISFYHALLFCASNTKSLLLLRFLMQCFLCRSHLSSSLILRLPLPHLSPLLSSVRISSSRVHALFTCLDTAPVSNSLSDSCCVVLLSLTRLYQNLDCFAVSPRCPAWSIHVLGMK